MKTVRIEGDAEKAIVYKAVVDTGTSFLAMKEGYEMALKNV